MVGASAAVPSNLAFGEGAPAEAEGAGGTGLRETGPWRPRRPQVEGGERGAEHVRVPSSHWQADKDPTEASLPRPPLIHSVCL